MGCFSLYFLKLSGNKLRGQIFPESIDLPDLTLLYLDSNEFSSSVPKSLSTIPLALLDIIYNFLPRGIPTSVGSLSTNQPEGPIPKEICNLNDLSLLDLSKNKLCGSAPSCFNPSSIRHIYLNDNQLEGELTYAFSNSSSLRLLDLGWNKFIGRIPEWIGNLSSLSIILLRDCFGNITLEVTKGKFSKNNGVMDSSSSQTFTSYMDKVELEMDYHIPLREVIESETMFLPITAIFMTKRNCNSYTGRILNYMLGINLSFNKFYGEIPHDLGN
ncbi:LRR receptor-like serine threonine- kinase GSO1 [Olea europaea subsp. europaea]|uniref:LRR receptor-like serine threonine- kinase GSO1 n=1 Tax=Olea europaea subsp. europaea TaxID=158383 RepID=A0A8S0TXI5_OLEEU|nr:LRR receptor-like serine threonine- kinase GSO1 [Olea europaea subsp. europaea]